MMTQTTSFPLVFVLTPRLGDFNHRFLVPSASMPAEADVRDAYGAVSSLQVPAGDSATSVVESDDILAVRRTVTQKQGRSGDEWLVVRDPRVRHLSADRISAILQRMSAELADLAPPTASEAAATSESVPFPALDGLVSWVDSSLGTAHTPPTPRWSPIMMSFTLAGLLGIGIMAYSFMGPPERGGVRDPNRGNDGQPTGGSNKKGEDELAQALGGKGGNAAAAVVNFLRAKASGLHKNATLLQAVNVVRPEIAGAENSDYKTEAEALGDKRMLSAIRSLIVDGEVDSFLDVESRVAAKDLTPELVRDLHCVLTQWPEGRLASERKFYDDVQSLFMRAAKAASSAKAPAPRCDRIFVYSDGARVKDLLTLFRGERDGTPTELGTWVAATAQKPETLADWIQAAASAHKSSGDNRDVWLSREVLVMHQKQEANQNESGIASKFYESLDEFLVRCGQARAIPANKPGAELTVHPEERAMPTDPPLR